MLVVSLSIIRIYGHTHSVCYGLCMLAGTSDIVLSIYLGYMISVFLEGRGVSRSIDSAMWRVCTLPVISRFCT